MEIFLLPLLLLGAALTVVDLFDGSQSPSQDEDEDDSEGASPERSTDIFDSYEGSREDIGSPDDESSIEEESEESEFQAGDTSSNTIGDDESSIIIMGPRDTVAYGGAGDDKILSPDINDTTMEGGDGSDSFLLADLIKDSDDALDSSAKVTTISDFDTVHDLIGIVLDSGEKDDLEVTSDWNFEENLTEVKVFRVFDESTSTRALIADIRLEGVRNFDPSDIKFFNRDVILKMDADFEEL